MATVPVVVPRPKNWIVRHWVLVVVLAACLVLAAVCAIIALIGGVFMMMGNSDAARMAVAKAEKTPAITQRLGTPIKKGMVVSGKINVQGGGTGHAELTVPISGPKGDGTLYLVANKKNGVWEFDSLDFTGDDGTRINLLQSSTELPQPQEF